MTSLYYAIIHEYYMNHFIYINFDINTYILI